MKKWEREEGVKFLKKIGIKTGQTVLDFGARVGHYSIPAAIAVEREKLCSEIHRVLKQDGFLSVYPKHVIEDSPLDQFKQLEFDDVKKEIQDLNFNFQEKNCDTISHDDFFNPGCVFNFIKS